MNGQDFYDPPLLELRPVGTWFTRLFPRRWIVLFFAAVLIGILLIGALPSLAHPSPVTLVGPAVAVAAVVIAGVPRALYSISFGRARLSVTRTALVFTHLRARRIDRGDIRELVVGAYDKRGWLHPRIMAGRMELNGLVYVVDREGHRRLRFPMRWWGRENLDRLAEAMNVEIRDAERGRDDALLPFNSNGSWRSFLIFGGVVTAIVVLVVLVLEVIDPGSR